MTKAFTIVTFCMLVSAVQAFTVVDGTGKIVGTMLDGAQVVRQEGGTSVVLEVSRSELHGGSTELFYETADCSGQAYIAMGGLVRPTVTVHDASTGKAMLAYYPADPVQTRAILSKQRVSPPAESCTSTSTSVEVGPAASFDVSGFVSPFVLQ